MCRNRPRLLGRTPRKHLANRLRHARDKDLILLVATNFSVCAPNPSFVSIRATLLFRLFQRSLLDQHTLPLVSLPRPAETNHHGGKRAVLSSTPRQRRVASGQINEMIQVGARQAEGAFALQEQEIAAQ